MAICKRVQYEMRTYIWTILAIFVSRIDDLYAHDNYGSAERARCAMDDTGPLKTKDSNLQYQQPFEVYQPRQQYNEHFERHNNHYETRKRSATDSNEQQQSRIFETNNIQKRQVGVVYGNGEPIGILQPFEQSYKFIPVKAERAVGGVAKRDTNDAVFHAGRLQDDYPSILANFKINNRISQAKKGTLIKRSVSHVPIQDKIQEKLESILDEMGLLDTKETSNAAQKRSIHSQRLAQTRHSDDAEDSNESSAEGADAVNNAGDERVRQRRNPSASFAESDISNSNTKIGAAVPACGGGGGEGSAIEQEKNANQSSGKEREHDDEKSRRRRSQEQEQLADESSLHNADNNLLRSNNQLPFSSNSNYDIETRDLSDQQSEDEDAIDLNTNDDKARRIQRKLARLGQQARRDMESLRTKKFANSNFDVRENGEDDQSNIFMQNEGNSEKRRKRQTITLDEMEKNRSDLDPLKVTLLENDRSDALKPLVRRRRRIDDALYDRNQPHRDSETKFESDIDHKERRKRQHNNLQSQDEQIESLFDDEVASKRELHESAVAAKRNIPSISRRQAQYDDNNDMRDSVVVRHHGIGPSRRSRAISILDDDGSEFIVEPLDEPEYVYDDREASFGRSRRDFDPSLEDYEDYVHGTAPQKNTARRYRVLRSRRRITDEQSNDGDAPNRPLQLSDMSSMDIFGPLPEGYDGELSRFKRIR